MTFCVAFATPNLALAAADTGRWRHAAAGEPVERLPGTYRKLVHVESGWLALSGVCAIADLVKAQPPPYLLERAPMRAAIETLIADMPAERARYARERSEALIVGMSATGASSGVWNYVAGTVEDRSGTVNAIVPFGADPARMRAALDDYEDALVALGTLGPSTADAVRRLTAQLFAHVHTLTPAVDDMVEIGMMLRHDDGRIERRHYGPARQCDVAAGTPEVAVAFGGGLISSSGRIKVVYCHDNRAPVAHFPLAEIEQIQIVPGFRMRVPEYFVGYNWNGAKNRFDGELRWFSSPGLNKLGKSRVDAVQRFDDEAAKYIHGGEDVPGALHHKPPALAQACARRIGETLGTGMIYLRWRSTYMYPELEPGDVVTVETNRLLLKDPHSGRAIRGPSVVVARIMECNDPNGTEFGGWVQRVSDILGSTDSVEQWFRQPHIPREIVVPFGRFVPAYGSAPWFVEAEYGRPAAAGTGYSVMAALTPFELRDDAHLVDFTTRAYIGNVGGSGDPGIIVSRLIAAPLDGGSVIILARAVFDIPGTGTPPNVWTTKSADDPAINTVHTINWNLYHYYTDALLSSVSAAGNARLMQQLVVWR